MGVMDESSSRIEEGSHRARNRLLERGLDSEGASSSKSQSELHPRSTREILGLNEKPTIRRLTLAPIPEEDSLMSTLEMLKKREEQREDDFHQILQHEWGRFTNWISIELMNLALACARGNLQHSSLREKDRVSG
jgi:hypothetical protein